MTTTSQRTVQLRIDQPRIGYTYIARPKAEVHFVRAEVRSLRERGYIAASYRMAEIDDYAVAEVLPLRPLPRPMKLRYRIMAWAAMALGALSGLGYLIWASRWIILIAAATAVAAALVALLVSGASSKGCAGVHVKH